MNNNSKWHAFSANNTLFPDKNRLVQVLDWHAFSTHMRKDMTICAKAIDYILQTMLGI